MRRFNKRSFIMSRKPTPVRALILITIFLVPLAFAAPVSADLIVWNLTGVTLNDGYDSPVTGSFIFNTDTSKISDWNITTTSPIFYNFTPGIGSDAITALYNNGGVQFQDINIIYQDAGFPVGTPGTNRHLLVMLYETPDINSLSVPGYHPLAGGGSSYGYIENDGEHDVGYLFLTGALTSVPLPPSMLLLGSGLLGLAGWRRFRKG
jgi:hypothetical protein